MEKEDGVDISEEELEGLLEEETEEKSEKVEEKQKEKEPEPEKAEDKTSEESDLDELIGEKTEQPKEQTETQKSVHEPRSVEEDTEMMGIGEPVVKPKDTEDAMEESERILVYGSSKVGKTHTIASMMDSILKKNSDTNFFVVVTDAGFWKTVKRYWKLQKLDTSVLKKQVRYYPVVDINEMFEIIKDIRASAKKTDWIIIDVMSDFWERAQDKFIESCSDGMTGVADLIVEASRDPGKFGTLSGFQWGYCKRLDNSISYYFVINPPCNVLATSGDKSINVAKSIGGEEKAEETFGWMYESFNAVGARPAGQKHLSYKFDDIVYIGKQSDGDHFFVLIGSRDVNTSYEKVNYGFSFWDSFMGHKKEISDRETVE